MQSLGVHAILGGFRCSAAVQGNSTTAGPVVVPLGPSATSGSGTPMYNPPFTGSCELVAGLGKCSAYLVVQL